MTQEKLIKDSMIRTHILLALALIALFVFIGLYIDEKNRVQETYRAEFITCLNNTSASIDSYLNAEGDLPLRYRQILSDYSSANSFAFLMTGLTEEQKIAVNKIHACLLKYPEQMQETERLKDFKKAVIDMSQNLDKGFDEAADVADSVNKKGF